MESPEELMEQRLAEFIAVLGPPPWRMWYEHNREALPDGMGEAFINVLQAGDYFTAVDVFESNGPPRGALFPHPLFTLEGYSPAAVRSQHFPTGRRSMVLARRKDTT